MSGGTFDDADYYEVPESIDVYSWCPTPDASGPATQVHLHFGKAPGPVFVVRFKSRSAIDKLIAALMWHGNEVFPRGGSR